MIKYRAWDTVQKKYIDSDDASISGNGILTVVGIEGKYHMSVQPPNDLAPRFIIEQYTGLKDKNGREIHEGDIVSVRDSPVAVEDEEGVCYVAWSSVLAGFLLKGSDAYKFDEQSLSDLKLIIIGNIHENAELLEGGE